MFWKRRTTPGGDDFERLLEQRLRSLESVFGPHREYLVSPVPFYLGGNPTVVGFPSHVTGAVVYCTHEMTGGWGSGQKPNAQGEYEIALTLPDRSPLAPKQSRDAAWEQGWLGTLLGALAKYSCTNPLEHGNVSGPLPTEFAPFTHILWVQYGPPVLGIGGRSCGILMGFMLLEQEMDWYIGQDGKEAFVATAVASPRYPVSDPGRAPLKFC